MLLLSSADSFQNELFQKILSGASSLDPDQDLCSVGPDLGPNCLQGLSAEYSKERVKCSFQTYI